MKLQKRYKLSVGGERAQAKSRPRGDHKGAEIGRVEEKEPQGPAPVEERDGLTPSDKLLLEVSCYCFEVPNLVYLTK